MSFFGLGGIGTAISDATGTVVSTANSTSTPLSAGATFTGTAELVERPSMIFRALTDQAGTMYVDVGVDGTNWDSTLTFTVSANVSEVHRLEIGEFYFRVRFANTSASNQTFLRLRCSFGTHSPLTTPLNLTVATDADTLVTRTTDFDLDVAQGRFSGVSAVTKFGANTAVPSGAEADIWASGGLYTGWLTTAATLRIKAGGHANDTAAGSGARSIRLEGLDANFNETSALVVTNGASASSATAGTFIRLFRAYVVDVGTYHGSNAAAIVIETSGGTVVGQIALRGQTQMALYTIPAGYTGYLAAVRFTCEGSKASDFYLNKVENADDVTVPYTGRRLIISSPGVVGTQFREFKQYRALPAKTDVWVSAVGPSGGASCSAAFDIILVAN